MGQLAKEKGQSDAVKSYGQMLVTDHSANNEKAIALAEQNRFSYATDPRGRAPSRRLATTSSRRLSGAAFDREFAKMMVMDHKEDVRRIQAPGGEEGRSVWRDLLTSRHTAGAAEAPRSCRSARAEQESVAIGSFPRLLTSANSLRPLAAIASNYNNTDQDIRWFHPGGGHCEQRVGIDPERGNTL